MPLPEAPYPSGKGAVCKTAMRRFEPARRLHTLLPGEVCPEQYRETTDSGHGERCPEPLEGQSHHKRDSPQQS